MGTTATGRVPGLSVAIPSRAPFGGGSRTVASGAATSSQWPSFLEGEKRPVLSELIHIAVVGSVTDTLRPAAYGQPESCEWRSHRPNGGVMDASRTHAVTHGQSVWSWVVIGAVGLALALAITVGVVMDTDDVVVKAPAPAEVGAGSRIGPATGGFAVGRGGLNLDAAVNPGFAVGRGGLNLDAAANPGFAGAATGIRESGTYAGTFLGSFTDVRESGAYYGAEDVGATPHHGRCPPKHGC